MVIDTITLLFSRRKSHGQEACDICWASNRWDVRVVLEDRLDVVIETISSWLKQNSPPGINTANSESILNSRQIGEQQVTDSSSKWPSASL